MLGISERAGVYQTGDDGMQVLGYVARGGHRYSPLPRPSDFGGCAVRLPGFGNDFTASRICSTKRSTTGFWVRFFSVRITTGHGRTGKSTGNIFKALTCTHELG